MPFFAPQGSGSAFSLRIQFLFYIRAMYKAGSRKKDYDMMSY